MSDIKKEYKEWRFDILIILLIYIIKYPRLIKLSQMVTWLTSINNTIFLFEQKIGYSS